MIGAKAVHYKLFLIGVSIFVTEKWEHIVINISRVSGRLSLRYLRFILYVVFMVASSTVFEN